MRVYGVDFTSRPSRRKPIACLACRLEGEILTAGRLERWPDFEGFEKALQRAGPWIAGLDFPFGQARVFVQNIGWPMSWSRYVGHVQTLTRTGFRAQLDAYRSHRPAGDREHRRATDRAAGALSPQKLYGTPVALMFYEGAPRLRAAQVTIPGLQRGDPRRVAVEAYPGLLARQLIGRRSYKQDAGNKQTRERSRARQDLFRRLGAGSLHGSHGLRVEAPPFLAGDPTGDSLDALLCAIQAAWAWLHRGRGYGAPRSLDRLEGWIADPTLANDPS